MSDAVVTTIDTSGIPVVVSDPSSVVSSSSTAAVVSSTPSKVVVRSSILQPQVVKRCFNNKGYNWNCKTVVKAVLIAALKQSEITKNIFDEQKVHIVSSLKLMVGVSIYVKNIYFLSQNALKYVKIIQLYFLLCANDSIHVEKSST